MLSDFLTRFFKKNHYPSENHSYAAHRLADTLIHLSSFNQFDLLKELNTNEHGLSQIEAEKRLVRYGFNTIIHEKPVTWFGLLLRNFANPFNALLIILGIVALFLKDFDAAIIIATMVGLSISIRTIQELRSNRAESKLKGLVSTQATVLRQGNQKEIDVKFLVPGDVIHLSAGDMVPADVRILSAKELFISQSSLTGESTPVEKSANGISSTNSKENTLFDIPTLAFTGTTVINGSATALVLKTGPQSYFGSMSKHIIGHRAITSFDIGINKVSWLLIKMMCLMAPLVFLINGFNKHDWLDALLFGLAVAVGLTPEMLPMIVTANLAKGAVKMSKSKVIVKQLNAIQNFGAMDILCTDKTGTLTLDRVILEKHLDIEGKDDIEVLNYGYINSFYQTGLKNLLDIAILDHKELKETLQLDHNYKKIDEIPFDFERRRMSVIVEKNPQIHLLICKGALEEILNICSKVKLNNSLIPINETIKEQINALKKDLNEEGLRVLAVAIKDIPNGSHTEYHAHDENSMILLGYLAFLDPPKNTTTEALANLKKLNVKVKVLTGDNPIVTRKICTWVNLDIEGILLGPEIELMDDQTLKKEVEKSTIFAKLSPLQKAKVVSILKANGHIVGYLGDGINDAAALREADIGISVDTAVDIAKESADIIMLEKSLLFLAEGVVEGRRTFANLIKYIKMALSSNFGNAFSLLGASIFFPFLPMMPVQLLIQNLLYDFSQTAIPFDNVDKSFTLKPQKWDPSRISKFMLFIGPVSSIFDYVTFAILWFVFGANSIPKQAFFQTGWFMEGLLSQALIVHMIRTEKIPFLQSTASIPLLLTTTLVIAIGLLIPYTYIGTSVGFIPLPSSFYPWLFGIILSYCLSMQFVKVWFIKRFKFWL